MEFIDNELEKIYKINELDENLLRLSELSSFCCDQMLEILTTQLKDSKDDSLNHVNNYLYIVSELVSIQNQMLKLIHDENI